MTKEQQDPPLLRRPWRAGSPHPAGCVLSVQSLSSGEFQRAEPDSTGRRQSPPAARVTAASLESVFHKSSAGTVEILTRVRYRGGFSSFK